MTMEEVMDLRKKFLTGEEVTPTEMREVIKFLREDRVTALGKPKKQKQSAEELLGSVFGGAVEKSTGNA